MAHAVHYRNAAGETKVEEVGTLDAAVSMVERLRNDEGVSDVRVYKQVPIEFKTYYKVSVVDDSAGAGPGAAPQAAPAPAPAAEAPPQPQAQASPSGPSGAASAAPQSPPPGAMPLGPSGSSQPSAQPSAQPQASPSGGNDDGDSSKRGSLFSRG